MLGILTDTADTDSCCCYRRLSLWTEKVLWNALFSLLGTNQKCLTRHKWGQHWFPIGNEKNVCCVSTHVFHSRELSSTRRWAIGSDGVARLFEMSSFVKVVLLAMCSLVFAYCLVGCNSRWDLSLSDNDSVLSGTCNQVKLSIYVFPQGGFRLHSSLAEIFTRTEMVFIVVLKTVMVQKSLFRVSKVR